MTNQETRCLEMLARVREFGATHPEIFPAGSRHANLLATVAAVVDELATLSAAQQAGIGTARAGGSNRAKLRGRLRESLDAMRRSAREIAVDVPGVDRQFRLPRSTGDQAVLGAARNFLAKAVAFKPMFAEQMLGPEFFAELSADVAAFEQALSVQRRGRDASVAATVAIGRAIARGVRTVQSLNTLMLNQFGKEKTVLAAWKSACRIHSSNVRGAAPAAEAPTSIPTEPVMDAA